jgi:hypothetical protein
MLKTRMIFKIVAIFFLSFFLQSCSYPDYWFMVTNTKAGNVCVEDMELAVTDPKAKEVSTILYARYGANEGEKKMYANPGGFGKCSEIREYEAPIPNLIISVEFYQQVIEPEYHGRKPSTDTN